MSQPRPNRADMSNNRVARTGETGLAPTARTMPEHDAVSERMANGQCSIQV